MEKILLIEPGTTVKHPPLGLLHLASFLREKYEVIIKDYSGKDLNETEIERAIRRINPIIVGLRVLTGPSIPRAIIFSKIAKKLDIPVIWGGPHPTILPEQTLQNENVDAVCIGEGEFAFLDFIEYLKGEKKEALGCGVKENKKIKIFGPQKRFLNFKEMKLPAWDLLDNINDYFPGKKHNTLIVSVARGCAFKCGFCHNSNKNVNCYLGYYRILEPQKAIEEFKFVQNLIKGRLDFLDVGSDLHIVSYDYAKKFCEAIKNSGVDDLKWNTSTRFSIINEKIVNLIARYNCKKILFGVESGSKRIQEINGKVVELDKAAGICRLLRRKKIFVTNAYIFGHPTETYGELKETINFIKKIPADENLIQLYRPMPGTPYFDMCVKEGKIERIPKRLEDWGGFGVLGHDINVSRIPDDKLFYEFYKINAWEQTKFLLNEQRYYLREDMYSNFLKNFINNRFTHKFVEMVNLKNG